MTEMIRLYGTAQSPEPPRRLAAGPLSAELEAGNLRYVRFDGIEVLRAISFLVRGPRWATLDAEIADLAVEQSQNSFVVTYRATVQDAEARLGYTAKIEGRSDGTLVFAATVVPVTDFETARTGFVVLHAAQIAGQQVQVEHADGRTAEHTMPLLIDPVQPLLDLRALTHQAAPDLAVTCRMEGDVFEMEDQRNWTDASFKTYVRPLSRPWPYVLPAGSRSAQSISLVVQRNRAAQSGGQAAGPIRLEQGGPLGSMPEIGLGCKPDEARAALPHAARLAEAGIAVLVCRVDPELGRVPDDLRVFRALAEACGCEVELQIVLRRLDDFASELLEIAEAVRAAGLALRAVAVSPAPDLKSTTPGQPWPECPPLEAVYAAARTAFPGVPLGGGTFAYFTELNRKRPPAGLDFVTFSTSPLVHAADDRSVMESLQALPFVAASARAIAGTTPFVVGPSAIGMRDNPYGPTPLANSDGRRLVMGGADPRQRGQFNAAWTLGYIARFAEGGANRVAVSAPVGPSGIMDQHGIFPVFTVVAGCAALRGATLHEVRGLWSSGLAAVLAVLADRQELWLANLTPQPQAAELPAWAGSAEVFRVDPADQHGLQPMRTEPGAPGVQLKAYDVIRCVGPLTS